ncbi:MAG TPA: SDR family NAD(P)-dependent oxidoreductase [Magnetospirillaceae bacterium]|nr:SDR family NAD(P)-dependent oxidoreductase [Magnetospirillaceae bacterium]
MNKRWLITGAGSGLGRALAEAALRRGDKVAALQRGGEDIAGARTWRLDVRDQAASTEAVHAAEAELGGIDVLVPNAGYGLVGGVEEASDIEWRDQFEVNFFSVMTLLRAALPGMRARRSGRILAISSVSGLVGWPSLGPYSASKFALEGALETLALETAPLGIPVTLIEPGGLRTGFSVRSRRQSEQVIDDYETTVGQSRRLLAEHAGQEAGDPVKAADAILAIADHPAPPLRLLLGEDALLYTEGKLAQQRAEIEAWREVTLGIGF